MYIPLITIGVGTRYVVDTDPILTKTKRNWYLTFAFGPSSNHSRGDQSLEKLAAADPTLELPVVAAVHDGGCCCC